MSAKEIIDSSTLLEQLKAYETTAFNTEDGGNADNLTTFSWAGTSSSSYSFGLYQFDVLGNPSAQSALAALGFSSTQISQLEQHGGLDDSTLDSLNTTLQTALSTPSGQQVLQGLLANQESNLTGLVLDEINNADDVIAS